MATTTNVNLDTTPEVLQNYALLQIAAETFLGTTDRNDAAAPPTGSAQFSLNSEMLTKGNLHSTKMTPQQAADFSANWKVVSHQANTVSGFSATLFEYIGTGSQPTASKYIVSFRSTEIIEDYVRDGVATNELEIQETGWAFGQLSDMRKWWATVESKIPGVKVDVTGYSLGGHLAAAFNQLYPDKVNKYYTFNGAGIGEVVNGYGQLGAAIDTFAAMRDSGSGDLFTNANGEPGSGLKSLPVNPENRGQVSNLYP